MYMDHRGNSAPQDCVVGRTMWNPHTGLFYCLKTIAQTFVFASFWQLGCSPRDAPSPGELSVLRKLIGFI